MDSAEQATVSTPIHAKRDIVSPTHTVYIPGT